MYGRGVDMDLMGFVTPVFAPVLSFAQAHGVPVGIGLLVLGAILAFLERGVSHLVLAIGVAVTAVFAYREWTAAGDLMITLGIAAVGLGITLVLAAVVRFVALIAELAVFAAGWYLLLYAFLGPAFLATNVGLAAWGVAAIASAVTVDQLARRRRASRVAPVQTVPYGTA